MLSALVVDDSASARELVEAMLSALGFRVTTARDGHRAVQVLREQAIDLIITDIYMPEGDGLEVIRTARTICPKTPIMAMSGMTGKRDMLKVARCLGAAATLLKPFSITDLLAAVDEALGKHEKVGARRLNR